jgi:hypothetical protein
VIHQDASHHFGRDGEEMRAILPIRLSLADEPEVRFVDERGGLQGVPWTLAPKPGRCPATKLLVHGQH